MAKSATHEIFSTRMWDFLPNALHGYKQKLDDNIAARIPFLKNEERDDRPFILSAKTGFSERTYIENADWINFDRLDEEDKVINVINIQGAILRNGDACAYGSKEHRDIIKRAANDSHTIGHLILMDSGGGSSYAKYDYEDAINYARSKGQPVIGLIDGWACSAGYAPMAMCDEVYAVGLHDQIGCIGTLAAFYTSLNGDKNSITQEQYVEVYAEGSPYKNKEFRDAAQGDNTELQKEVNDLCIDFQGMVAKYRPQTTEEQRKGAVFPAGDVIGTLIDGQGTMESCITRIMELSGTQPASTSTSPTTTNQPEGAGDTGSSATSDRNNQQSIINKENMKEYPQIMAALGLNALVSDKENGLYFNEQMADALTVFAENAGKTENTLAAKLQETTLLNGTIEQMKKDQAQALADLTAAHATELSNLQATKKTEVDGLSANLKTAQDLIVAKDAEIKELSEATQNPPAPAGGKPTDNGSGAQQEPKFKAEPICKEGLTNAEKAEAHKKREAELAKQIR